MDSIKPKSILLQAYDIENNDVNSAHSDFLQILQQRLNADESANKRRLKLSLTSSSEEDVLADFYMSENGVFGVLMRISPTEEVATIPDSLFNGKTVQLSEPRDPIEPTVTVLNTVYFYAGKKFLISTLPPSQIKRLQVYFEFLLSFDGKDRKYSFAPSIEIPNGIRLNEMKELIIGEQSTIPTTVSNEVSEEVKVYTLAVEYLKNLVSITPEYKEIINNKILNAKLLISFTRPRKMPVEDYKRILSAYIKPISDIEDVKFKLKNKKTLKGKDVLRTKNVSIERLDKIRLNEADLRYEMKEFLNELG